jgi:hypothetical protein
VRSGIIFRARVPDKLQRVSVAAQSRAPGIRASCCCMGPGSAAHRQRGAALRPGHESPNFSSIATCIIRVALHSRGTPCPSFALNAALKSAEGAGKAGCRLAPAVHCAKACAKNTAQRHTGEAKHPAFPAQWFYGLCRDLLGERCTIAPVALRMADDANPVGRQRHHKPWRADPGRRDHTILPYAGCARRVRASSAHGVTRPANRLRATRAASTTFPSRVRDDRDPPLGPGWDGQNMR